MTAVKSKDSIIAQRKKSIGEQIDAIKNDPILAMQRSFHSIAMYELERKSARKR